MTQQAFSIEETIIEEITAEELNKIVSTGARIKVIGVGGGGGNMINHMSKSNTSGIDLIVANTDAQVLEKSLADVKLQLGVKLTKGLGAGMKPEVGRESALESYEDIKNVLSGADIVFVATGLGGGTGTGAAPIVAQAAREIGALTIAVVTKPFKMEGRKRSKLADHGLSELKKESDSIVVIPNEKLLSLVDKNLGIKDSFKMVDEVLSRAVSGTSGIILSSGEDDINVDFADLQTVMSHRGLALMGVGEAQGDRSAFDAVKKAIDSPLLDNVTIDGAMGVLVHFHINPAYPLTAINEAMEIAYESADEDADVIFGTTTDEDMDVNSVRITIVATGFERELQSSTTNNQAYDTKDANSNDLRLRKPLLKIVGGDVSEDYLDIPTYMRNQKD